MVAVSQAPSSEMLVRLRPSGETWRFDQPPKARSLAVMAMPPRHRRRPTVLTAGSCQLSASGALWIWKGCSWAPAGGRSDALVQAGASRQSATRERIVESKMRPSSRRAHERPCDVSAALGGAPSRLVGGGRDPTPAAAGAQLLGVLLVEQGGELLHHGATELIGVDD